MTATVPERGSAFARRVTGLLWRNPVLGRELTERLRVRRTTITITLSLAILALVLYLAYESFTGDQGSLDPTEAASVGRTMFETILFVLLLVIALIVPGNSADAITGERERQTLHPLQATQMTPRAILLGKTLSAVAYVVLVVLAALPLLGISFVLGGLTVGRMVRGVVAIVATGLVFAGVGVTISSLVRRTQPAVLLSYAFTAVLLIGTWVAVGALSVLGGNQHEPARWPLLWNPMAATASALDDGRGSVDRSPFAGLQAFLRDDIEEQFGRVEERVVIGPDGEQIEPPQPLRQAEPERSDGPFPFWLQSALVLGGTLLVAFAWSTRRLEVPSSRIVA